VLGLMLAVGAGALVAGVLGFALASADRIALAEPLASRVPPERHDAFLADLWAHSASYLLGALGGLSLIVRVAWSRRTRRCGRERR
jgi:hypothetical protein